MRCTGHCCRCFPLSFSPDELQQKAAAGELVDGEQVAAMVVYIGERTSSTEPNCAEPSNDQQHFYTCSNLTPEGDCAIYETRPSMCKQYPYGNKCGYSECTGPEGK